MGACGSGLGAAIAEIFASKGEHYFREREQELTRELQGLGNMILAPGGGWVTNENTSYNIVTASIPTDASNDYWKINLSNPDSVAHTVQYMHLCLPK